jgi:hypothetical protein
LNVTTGEVFGECSPTRDGADLPRVPPPSRHTARGPGHPRGLGQPVHAQDSRGHRLAGAEPERQLHFTPVGSSWINQIEIWFGIITRQAIRRGTFASVTVLIKRIRDYITDWNTNARPFHWTATTDEILAKVQLVQQNIQITRTEAMARGSRQPTFLRQ